jgi:outer membrane protein OmpA-like peptidoglycan-associated protein
VRAALFGTLVLLALGFVAASSGGSHAAARTCEAVATDIAAARKAGDVDRLAVLWSEAKASDTACEEKSLYCLGQSIALGHLEVAYARGDGGAKPEEIAPLLDKGLAYGSPWQLRVGRGDLTLARAKAGHDGGLYSDAALDYQEALIAIGEPPLCVAFGEAPRPAVGDIAPIYQRMTTALLLAKPVKVATTKCAPCQWLFIAGVAGFTPAVRPLPITFASDSVTPTPEGMEAVAALLDCIKAGGYSRVVLSGHTDQIGTAAYNLTLSRQRLETVRKLFVDGGFAGEIVIEAKGKSEPYAPVDAGYSPTEVRQLNRRIELRDATVGENQSCS